MSTNKAYEEFWQRYVMKLRQHLFKFSFEEVVKNL
jgi:hypothetical protein